MSHEVTRISEGVYFLGTFGTPQVISSYLVRGQKIALIEPGPTCVQNDVMRSVVALGVNPSEVSYVVVSHIHIDHAGGAGSLMRRMPKAKVVAYEPGAKHLVDPSRLIASA